MILDIKNQFCGWTECTATADLGTLDFGDIAEPGKGSPLYIHVFSDGGFTASAKEFSIRIKTAGTTPGTKQVLEIGPFTDTQAAVAGRLGIAALPSQNLEQFVTAAFYAGVTLAAGGSLRVELAPSDA